MPQDDSTRLATGSTSRHSLEHLPISRRFTAEPALNEELPALIELTKTHLPKLAADAAAIYAVHEISQSIIAIRSRSQLVGVFALLFLNAEGFACLRAGSLTMAMPGEEFLSRKDERTAALYVWAICLPGAAVGALGNVMQWLRQPSYADSDMYARPVTPAGKRIMLKTGFQPVDEIFGNIQLWVYRRTSTAPKPAAVGI